LKPGLECVAAIVEKHTDQVDRSEWSLKARKYDRAGPMYQRVWIVVELCYEEKRGLEVGRVLESRSENPDGIPSHETFEDKTEEYRYSPYVRGLAESIARDIRNRCLLDVLRFQAEAGRRGSASSFYS
jgi:hypothetical protein